MFSRAHFLIQNLTIGDQQKNLSYLQSNLIQESITQVAFQKRWISKQLVCALNHQKENCTMSWRKVKQNWLIVNILNNL